MKKTIGESSERHEENLLRLFLEAACASWLAKFADRILGSRFRGTTRYAGKLLDRAARLGATLRTAERYAAAGTWALTKGKDPLAAFTHLCRAFDADPGYAPAICPLLLAAEVVGQPRPAYERIGKAWNSFDASDRELVASWLRRVEPEYEKVTRGRTLIYGLSRAGGEDIVRSLLDAGVDPRVRNPSDGQMPIHAAAASGRVDLVELLLERGADVEACGEGGITPLAHVVTVAPLESYGGPGLGLEDLVWAGSLRRMVEELVRLGAAVDRRDQRGSTPLLLAAGQSRVRMVETLLRLGADPNGAGARGMTPLAAAMLQPGSRVELPLVVSTVAALLDGGADPCRVDDDGTTPLMTAAKLGFRGCTRCLLRKVAADEQGAAAVAVAAGIAVEEGHSELAVLLREAESSSAPEATGDRVS